MGFLAPAPDVPEIRTVATMVGPAEMLGPEGERLERYPRARTFVLEDQTVTVIHGAALERTTWPVAGSDFNSRTKVLTVVLGGEDPAVAGSVLRITNHCGCGWGAISNAGPADGPYRLAKVRTPEWHTVSR